MEVLTSKERKKLTVVLFFVFASAIMELFGLLTVLPFLAVMGKPSLIKSNYYYDGTLIKSINYECKSIIIDLIKVSTERKTQASIYLGNVIYNSSSYSLYALDQPTRKSLVIVIGYF